MDLSDIHSTCWIILLLYVWHYLGKNTFLRFMNKWQIPKWYIFKGRTRTSSPGTPTLYENIFGFVFVIFDCITHMYYNCSQHAMCIICFLFSTLTTKTKGRVCVKGHQNNPQTPKNYTAPQVLKFLDPPLILYTCMMIERIWYYYSNE